VALLREDLRARTSIFEFDEETGGLTKVSVPTLAELLDAPALRLTRHAARHTCELTASVVALAPTEIDFVRARHGETLRFNGLPFARVRRVCGREQLWFGVEGTPRRRTLLDEESAHNFFKLVAELREHRRADADDRLVVVELKVSEDAALSLQGADYWRRISTYQRAGHIHRARLFGDADILDESPLVYLVAPMLRFHRSFETLARCLTPEIETYRLDLNEDWRAGVRVARLMRIARVTESAR
jgi:hypothetical protein